MPMRMMLGFAAWPLQSAKTLQPESYTSQSNEAAAGIEHPIVHLQT